MPPVSSRHRQSAQRPETASKTYASKARAARASLFQTFAAALVLRAAQYDLPKPEKSSP
jgi:hypothetical protein